MGDPEVVRDRLLPPALLGQGDDLVLAAPNHAPRPRRPGSGARSPRTYKRLLLQQELDQVARHLASNLLVFSTGAEVEFADRAAVEQIVEQGREEGYPVRTMIHQVVQSGLFRSR